MYAVLREGRFIEICRLVGLGGLEALGSRWLMNIGS